MGHLSEFVCMQSGVQRLRARIRSPWRWTGPQAHMGGDNSNLSILNNGGKAGSEQDSEDEVRVAWAQSIKVSRAVSSLLLDAERHTEEVWSCAV